MNRMLVFISVLIFMIYNSCYSSDNPRYDSTLAARLGADDYGMKSYHLVILKTGTAVNLPKNVIDSCFRGHLANITRLVDEGKLIVAGPLAKNDNNYRGIFILNLSDKEETEKILQSDPAISNKLLGYDIYHWYGSAALSEYLDYADKIWKLKP